MAVGISAGELRESTEDELITKLRESKEELFNLRFQHATGQLENTARIKTVRRNIASIMTFLHQAETRKQGRPADYLPPRHRRRRKRGAYLARIASRKAPVVKG